MTDDHKLPPQSKVPLLFLLLLLPVEAEIALALDAAETVSWEQCVAEGQLGNPDLQSARADLSEARNRSLGARGAFLPEIVSRYTATRDHASLSLNQSSLSVTATETLFSGFDSTAVMRRAQADEEIAEARLQGALARISQELKRAFADVAFSQGAVKLAGEFIDRREKNLRSVRLRYENGSENKGSYLLSQAYLEQARLELTRAKHALAVAEQRLGSLLGRKSDSRVQIAGTVPLASPAEELKDLEALALQTPEHREAAAREKSADADVLLARAPFFPTITVFGSVGRSGTELWPGNSGWSTGVGMSYPLFNGGRDYFGLRAAIASRASSESGRVSVDLQLIGRIKEAHAAYVEADQRLKVDESFVEAAQVRARIARGKYLSGILRFDEWDIIESDLVQRQRNLLESRRDRVFSEAAWEGLIGVGALK